MRAHTPVALPLPGGVREIRSPRKKRNAQTKVGSEVDGAGMNGEEGFQSAAAFPLSGLLCRDRQANHWQAVKVLSPSAPNRGHPVFWSRLLGGGAVLCLSLLASRHALTVVWIELGAAEAANDSRKGALPSLKLSRKATGRC